MTFGHLSSCKASLGFVSWSGRERESEHDLLKNSWVMEAEKSLKYSHVSTMTEIIYDLFQPKMSTFSTRAHILVLFKTVHYFSQSIFSLVSYLKMHNTIYSLNCVVHFFSKLLHRYLLNSRT